MASGYSSVETAFSRQVEPPDELVACGGQAATTLLHIGGVSPSLP
jgi:hypothetical protein